MLRLVAALLALAALIGACQGAPTTTGTGCRAHGVISVGERIPDCSFDSVAGPKVVLRALEDKPLILNFWASWCIACIKEMPAFDQVYTEFAGRIHLLGVDVVGVQGETRAAARAFLTRTKVNYPIAFDDDGNLYEHFATSKARPIMPVTIFVAPGGIVKLRRFGELSGDELRGFIRADLGIA